MKLMLSSLLAGSLILSSVAAGFAQQTPTAAPASPAAAPAAAAGATGKASGLSDEAKKAKAKECSTQADAKGLHGKERKAFRQKCKQS
ncbi:PsiF family protein [Methylocella silvestris]|uniref:Phosphate starvation-inducible protein PsiF n=1 Tax=Methylocella silvestris TaxID=199596 RepID=A0A2J7TLH9_METSI|nr:PsiF family protein [Methylocella silvestris]PNG27614.1 phosphate starvation-inducible protein PsiF [Methylocella silvestris]